MKTSGLVFHCHHDQLIEFAYDIKGRQQAIRDTKSKNEIKLRLKLLRFIPSKRLPQEGLDEYIRAGKVYSKAWVTYSKAWVAYPETSVAWVTYAEASVACTVARVAYNRAMVAYYEKNKVALEELHKELCPDCPWNGWTIFTRRDSKGNWY